MKYNIIYADPPWSYHNDSDSTPNHTTRKGFRKPPYPVMGSKNICELQVQNICEDNCLLFIWTTDYHYEKCMNVINAWGFKYKTVGFKWQKLTKSNTPVVQVGAYTMKSGIEECFLATKGKDAHKLIINHSIRSLITSQKTKHSEKPAEVRDKIVQLCGDIPRVELFARISVPGWDSIGNEIDGKDIKEVLENLRIK